MSDFETAIPTILRHEGGFNNDPVDAGGATNYGVSLRWLKAQGLLEDLEQEDRTQDEIQVIKQMTQEQASALYKAYWWNPYNYGAIDSQLVATKIFDYRGKFGRSEGSQNRAGCPRVHAGPTGRNSGCEIDGRDKRRGCRAASRTDSESTSRVL